MRREFTGRHMIAVFVIGFGIVMAVNFYMASLAIGGFHGITVENTYVASQKFNGWLEEAKEDAALGWGAQLSRDEAGHLVAATSGVPADAIVTAQLRRPIGAKAFADLEFVRGQDGFYRSTQRVNSGRWTVRVSIASGSDRWDSESEL